MQEIIGWAGSLLYIAAYLLLSLKKLSSDKIAYQLLNILGGMCLIVNSQQKQDYPSIFTNAVWVAIGAFAIVFNYRKVISKER